MFQRHLIHRTFRTGLCGAAMFLCAAPALAKEKAGETRKVCTAAYASYKSGQEQQKAGHMRAAREQYQSCAQAPCGGLAPKCTAALTQLTSEMPTVVPVVTDEAGTPRVDVQVKVDGELLCSQLDGKGLPVEPGVHEFAFSTDSGVFATQKVMVVEGQRNRPITVSTRPADKPAQRSPAADPLAAAAAPPAETKPPAERAAPERPVPEQAPAQEVATVVAAAPAQPTHRRSLLPSAIVGGVGLAALGAGALLTYWGKKDNDVMGSGCGATRSCDQGSLDHIRNLYIASDIAVGAGVVALGVSAVLFATSGASSEPAPAPARTAAHYRLDLQPTRSGGFASVSGAF